MALFDLALTPFLATDVFDFGDPAIVRALREQGMDFAAERDGWRLPPTDTLFLHRKFGGTYLLAARLKARVDLKSLIRRYL